MSPCTPRQQAMYRAARLAGMSVRLMYLPGGHDWRLAHGALQANVGWLDSQLGITERAR